MEIVKQDIYHNKERWETWKQQKDKFEGLTPYNEKLLLEFLFDMEKGVNTPKRKGIRTATTLINQRDHISFFLKHFKKPITQVTKDEIHSFVKSVEDGKIKKKNGAKFTAFGNYIKDLKTFCGWLVRTDKTQIDITRDLSKSNDKKPAWVYLTEEEFKAMANRATPDYRALIWFFYDAGCRVTEGYSLRVKNFHKDFTELEIPKEVAKTFGRVIKLKICSSLIKEYVKFNNLKPDDLFIVKKATAFNEYLGEHCSKLFGADKETLARGKYKEFSIYSIRHNSACYWLKRYKELRGLKYRLGWSREEQATYYHEFLGLSDEISDEDMLTAEELNKVQRLEKVLQKNHKEFIEFKENFLESVKNHQESKQSWRQYTDMLESKIEELSKKLKKLEKTNTRKGGAD